MADKYLTPDEEFDHKSNVLLPSQREITKMTCWRREGDRYFPHVDRDCRWKCFQASATGYPNHHIYICPEQPWFCGETRAHKEFDDCSWVCLELPHDAGTPHTFETHMNSFS